MKLVPKSAWWGPQDALTINWNVSKLRPRNENYSLHPLGNCIFSEFISPVQFFKTFMRYEWTRYWLHWPWRPCLTVYESVLVIDNERLVHKVNELKFMVNAVCSLWQVFLGCIVANSHQQLARRSSSLALKMIAYERWQRSGLVRCFVEIYNGEWVDTSAAMLPRHIVWTSEKTKYKTH